MVKKISVLLLLEHIDREMDVACAIKYLAKLHFGVDIVIRHIYLHANKVLAKYSPSVVVFPFFYRSSDLAIDRYTEMWPDSIFFNLSWEELFYKANLKVKAPGDNFTRTNVIHHAWGNFFKDYLMDNGVPAGNIFLNGNPVYQLYQKPYKNYYMDRNFLAKKYGLDSSARWIFLPENYKWAFVPDYNIAKFIAEGGNPTEFKTMKSFCIESLNLLLSWCVEASRTENVEIIFRPRPAVNSKIVTEFFNKNIGKNSRWLHFIKGETVRDWILSADLTISSFSTSLIEAAIADKPIFMVEPISLPESLHCDWYKHVPRLYSFDDFKRMCRYKKETDSKGELKNWAEKEMLSKGDPIFNLTRFLKNLVDKSEADQKRSKKIITKNNLYPSIRSFRIRSKWGFKIAAEYCRGIIFFSVKSIKKFQPFSNEKKRHSDFIKNNNNNQTAPISIFVCGYKMYGKIIKIIAKPFIGENFFNPISHEKDEFTALEVEKRIKNWSNILSNL
jgi:surface carbohydrate biosynthesis protein